MKDFIVFPCQHALVPGSLSELIFKELIGEEYCLCLKEGRLVVMSAFPQQNAFLCHFHLNPFMKMCVPLGDN